MHPYERREGDVAALLGSVGGGGEVKGGASGGSRPFSVGMTGEVLVGVVELGACWLSLPQSAVNKPMTRRTAAQRIQTELRTVATAIARTLRVAQWARIERAAPAAGSSVGPHSLPRRSALRSLAVSRWGFPTETAATVRHWKPCPAGFRCRTAEGPRCCREARFPLEPRSACWCSSR